jgi:hypothetical protein
MSGPTEGTDATSVTTYVVVHGAWHGGRRRQGVARRPQAAGHEVPAPTLSGPAERASEQSASPLAPATHIDDITGPLIERGPTDVILVGHGNDSRWVTITEETSE